MSLFLAILIILASFYLMAKLIDIHFIKSLDNIAEWFKMPESVAGATLLAFGTSAPEISTALLALFLTGASPALGVGTIVGSAIFQILVVIGFAAIVKASYLNWKPVIRDSFFYAISIILLIVFINDGVFTFKEALMLVGGYVIYLLSLYVWTKIVDESKEPSPIDMVEEELGKNWPIGKIKKVWNVITFPIDAVLKLIPDADKNKKWTLPVFFLSLAIIGFACYWMVVAAEAMALTLGIPSAIIALTILAGGSSVPEMISSAIVSRQGRGDMAIANAVGSNIFDILMSLGLPLLIFTALRGPVSDLGDANIMSSLLLLFFTLLMVIVLLASQKFKATKIFGMFLVAVYVLYVVAAYLGWIG